MRPALYPVLFRRPLRGGPDLDLNFAAMTVLDPRVTYSGASLATLTDATGAIAYKPHNLLTYSEQFDNAIWAKTTASVTANSAAAPGGTSTADKLVEDTTASTAHFVANTVTVSSGVPHTLSVYLKAGGRSWAGVYETSSACGKYFNLATGVVGSDLGSAPADFAITDIGNGWFRCSIKVTTASTSSTFRVFAANADGGITYSGDGTSGIYVWGAQLNIGPLQPYYPTTSAAYYGPRFTYDPVTHASLGLLIEEQRTNLLLQSNELATTWSTFNAVTRTKNLVGIDGLTSGWTLTDSNASMGVVQQQLALGATTYTLSAYVLKTVGAQSSYPVIGVDNGSTLVANATIDTSNGVATVWTAYTGWTVTTSSATCVSYNASYWRVTLTFLATATNWNIDIVPAGTTNATQSTGVLSASAQGSAGFTCLQLEAGAFATSYIPTTSASVTRAADSATMTGSNFSSWFNATQGTYFVEWTPADLSGIPTALAWGPPTSFRNVPVYSHTTGAARAYNGTTILQSANTAPAGAVRKQVFAWASGSRYECLNGGTVVTDVASPYDASPTSLGIGSCVDGTFGMTGTIKRICYYNTALTNAQLQALTT